MNCFLKIACYNKRLWMARKYSIVKQSAPNQHSVILCNKISLHDWAKCLVRFGVVSWERVRDDKVIRASQKSKIFHCVRWKFFLRECHFLRWNSSECSTRSLYSPFSWSSIRKKIWQHLWGKRYRNWAVVVVVVVKWSACTTSTPTISVRILLQYTQFLSKIWVLKEQLKTKRGRRCIAEF